MYVGTVTGCSLWVAYGLMIKSLPVIFTNIVCLTLSSLILQMKWRFSRREPPQGGLEPSGCRRASWRRPAA